MNVLWIALILNFLSDIYGSNITETTRINILEILKSKNISCDLHTFVSTTGNTDDDYTTLIGDLTKYCFDSAESSKTYRIVCHMIFIELEIGCGLPKRSRPSPVQYTLPSTAKKICTMNKIHLTNSWIWEKLSSDEKGEIGSTSTKLCSAVASTKEILPLVKFFYKLAPRIRRVDLTNTASLTEKNSSDLSVNQSQSLTNINQTETRIDTTVIEQGNQSSINNTSGLSTVLNQTIEESANKALDIQHQQLILDTNGTIHGSVNNIRNQSIGNDLIPKQIDLNITDIKVDNGTIKSEEGLPLGRAGEEPEREQINERPKPKVLDVEAVFKVNDNEKQNWVEGKNEVDAPSNAHIFNHRRAKHGDSQLVPAGIGRKKSPFKLKSSRQLGHDDEILNDHFLTSFLIFILCIVVVYLIIHNKNKVLGLIIEGCKRRRAYNNRRQTTPTRHSRLSQSSSGK